jgi:catechol 2,3-dioxygenase-like lactoylglutathione lyase family enzyme
MTETLALQKRRWSVAPVLIVDDVVATANFYRDKLGFHYDRFWGDPPGFAMVYRASVTIMLKQFETAGAIRPNAVADPEREMWDAYIWIDDADRLYEEYQAAGVKIARPICDQEYGCRDFDIEDCNGYRLCFGQDLSS